ncbi:hypothetical protein HDZ31DRAFT_61776 [Schizophyllum fasciatum]
MRGKTRPDAAVWVNKTIQNQLQWIANHVAASSGVWLMDADAWGLDDADITLYTDASYAGMGVWIPDAHLGLQLPLADAAEKGIFYYEALSVYSALHYVLTHTKRHLTRIAILCDNSNTVDIPITTRSIYFPGSAAVFRAEPRSANQRVTRRVTEG